MRNRAPTLPYFHQFREENGDPNGNDLAKLAIEYLEKNGIKILDEWSRFSIYSELNRVKEIEEVKRNRNTTIDNILR